MVRVYLMEMEEEREASSVREAHLVRQSLAGQQSAAARALLQQALAREYPKLSCPVRLEKDSFGKPFLPDYPDICISISHSGTLAACAIGEKPVGVDVEQWKKRPGAERIAKKFHPLERKLLEQKNGNQSLFYALWVRKESFLKAVGEGLRRPLDSFCTVEERAEAEEAEPSVLLAGPTEVRQNICPEGYYLKQYGLGEQREGYSLAVCAQEQEFAPKAVWITKEA